METIMVHLKRLGKAVIILVAFLLTYSIQPNQAYAANQTTMAYAEGVTEEEVCDYLRSRAIRFLYVTPIEGTLDWLSTNSNGTYTRVYVVGNQIVGHENIDI